MSSHQLTPAEEMALAADLPQADASSLVDREVLEAQVKDMYRQVAREQDAALHFEVGRPLALRVGYPAEILDAIPTEALASFAGVGYHLDLAALAPGDKVLDLGSGSGTDALCAVLQVGESGHVVGVDFTDEQIDKAMRLRDRDGFAQVEFVEATIDASPSRTASSTWSSRTGSSTFPRSSTASSPKRRGSFDQGDAWRSPTSSAASR